MRVPDFICCLFGLHRWDIKNATALHSRVLFRNDYNNASVVFLQCVRCTKLNHRIVPGSWKMPARDSELEQLKKMAGVK